MDSIALLQTLLLRAEAERDTALAALRQAEIQMVQAHAQSEQLQSFRSEYDQRWTTRFRQSGTRELLQCHQSFGERIGEAISHQANTNRHLDQRVQRARKALGERELRVAAVRKLIERRQRELQHIALRREQRAEDETAQRQHQRRAAMQS